MSKQPVTPSVAADRVQKILRIAQELELALELARGMPNDFLKRTIARHVVVRAENFIVHHQRLVNTATRSVRDELKQTAKYYAEQFDALGFAEARHKYGAHVQDIEYGFDAEFWQNVDNVGLAFFVDGARELYTALGKVGVPEFVGYVSLAETSDAALKANLDAFAKAHPLDDRARFGTDPLAWVRPGTGAMINAHPLHVRAGRLALIRLWMKWQGKLAPLLMRFPDSARILRARMITDIVSFCDSLVSRPAQKHVEALDELLGRYGASKPDPACVAGLDVITQFLSSYAFEKRAAELRNPRNKYGAHLEIADATSLIHILQSFDAADFEQGLDFFGVLEVVFENTCRATRFLVSHIVGDEPLAGFSSDFEGEQNEPFERGRPDIIIEERQNSFILEDEAALNESLEQWLLSAQEDARTVWWHAFLSSKIVERTEPDADRNHRSVELRRAHTVVFERLNRATHAEAIGIIKLFQGCKRGAPQPLVCLVLRYARSASRQLSVPELAVALGDLASWKDVEAREYVLAWAKNADNSRDRVLAARALGRLFVEAEYCDRFNEKRIGVDFEGEVLSVADRFEPLVRAIVLAVFASSFAWGDLSGAQEGGQFHSDYLGCCEKLRKECEVFAGRERLARAIEGGDFVAVCLLLREATNCDADAALCAWAAGSAVTCSPWPASWLNLALALSFSGQGARARALVAEVARRHPQSTEVLVDCVQTASQVIDGRPLVEELATNLDQNYDLTTAQKAVIAACRR